MITIIITDSADSNCGEEMRDYFYHLRCYQHDIQYDFYLSLLVRHQTIDRFFQSFLALASYAFKDHLTCDLKGGNCLVSFQLDLV